MTPKRSHYRPLHDYEHAPEIFPDNSGVIMTIGLLGVTEENLNLPAGRVSHHRICVGRPLVFFDPEITSCKNRYCNYAAFHEKWSSGSKFPDLSPPPGKQ